MSDGRRDSAPSRQKSAGDPGELLSRFSPETLGRMGLDSAAGRERFERLAQAGQIAQALDARRFPAIPRRPPRRAPRPRPIARAATL